MGSILQKRLSKHGGGQNKLQASKIRLRAFQKTPPSLKKYKLYKDLILFCEKTWYNTGRVFPVDRENTKRPTSKT